MTLFKESIDDIIRDLREKRYKDAKRILEDHIENEHHLDSDLSNLQRTVGFYQKYLVESRVALSRLMKVPEPDPEDVETVIEYLENAQTEVGFIEELIKKLWKEGKLAE